VTDESGGIGLSRPVVEVREFRAHVRIPLWILLALIALPTAGLWYIDRRRCPPGFCRHCGYNLTGNVSGRCPECGTPTTVPKMGGAPS
jgi:hypothetical protein